MSKVKKPEPVESHFRFKTASGEWSILWFGLALSEYISGEKQVRHLVTTEQAEAYKDDCVREALEEAAAIADRNSDFATYDAIRALIPKQ